MTIVNELGTRRFFLGIDTEDDGNRLTPIGALGLGVKQAEVAREMLLIVWTHAIKLGWLIFERRFCALVYDTHALSRP